jgi:hypothetical protein
VLNIAGRYDPLLSLFERGVKGQFLNSVHREILLSDHCPERLVKRLPDTLYLRQTNGSI